MQVSFDRGRSQKRKHGLVEFQSLALQFHLQFGEVEQAFEFPGNRQRCARHLHLPLERTLPGQRDHLWFGAQRCRDRYIPIGKAGFELELVAAQTPEHYLRDFRTLDLIRRRKVAQMRIFHLERIQIEVKTAVAFPTEGPVAPAVLRFLQGDVGVLNRQLLQFQVALQKTQQPEAHKGTLGAGKILPFGPFRVTYPETLQRDSRRQRPFHAHAFFDPDLAPQDRADPVCQQVFVFIQVGNKVGCDGDGHQQEQTDARKDYLDGFHSFRPDS